MSNILFIGGPKEAIPGFGQAKAAGYTVFVTDGNPQAPGLLWAKKHGGGGGVADTYNPEDTLLMARQFPNLAGVLALACDVGPVVSKVAQELGLPHIPAEISVLSWDKNKLKQRLLRAGLSTPESHFIQFYRDTATLPAASRYVVKLNRGRGGQGCYLVDTITELQNILAELKPDISRGLVVEPFIVGPQISAEAIIWAGEVVFCGLTDRDYRFNDTYPYPVEFGGWGPSEYAASLTGLVLEETVKQAAAAVGVVNGTVKLDIVLNGNDLFTPVILEMAIGRLSGGYSATHYWPLAYNVNFMEMACQVACGEQPLLKPYKERPYALQCRGLYRGAKRAKHAGQRGRFFMAVGKTTLVVLEKMIKRERQDA